MKKGFKEQECINHLMRILGEKFYEWTKENGWYWLNDYNIWLKKGHNEIDTNKLWQKYYKSNFINEIPTGIKGYLFETENNQIVFSQMFWPKLRMYYKSDKDYRKAIEVWKKSFINVLNARPCSGEQPGTDIRIINSKGDSLIAEHANECLVSLKPKGALVLCILAWGSWTSGYGVFGDTPKEAINFYKEYVKWLKIRKPGDFPPTRNRR